MLLDDLPAFLMDWYLERRSMHKTMIMENENLADLFSKTNMSLSLQEKQLTIFVSNSIIYAFKLAIGFLKTFISDCDFCTVK